MPPIRPEKKQKLVEQEGRILLAIEALKNGEISSMRKAASIFDIPFSTLQRRHSGVESRIEKRANGHKLTETEEKILLEWTISLDARGSAPRTCDVSRMANILLADRGTNPPLIVGRNWVTTFAERMPEIRSTYSKPRDFQRAKQEDPIIINDWFKLVEKTIREYGIVSDDIYNFDETGFAMGQCATAKVITRAGYYGRRAKQQPGNRQWVTAIECLCASG